MITKKKKQFFSRLTVERFTQRIHKNSDIYTGALRHYNVIQTDTPSPLFSPYITSSELTNIILDPSFVFGTDTEIVLAKPKVPDFEELEKKKRTALLRASIYDKNYVEKIAARRLLQHQEVKKKKLIGSLNNVVIGDSLFDSEFERRLRVSDVECVLVLSDTSYTRNLKVYKRIIEKLIQYKVQFIEYTNVQPKLDRKLVFKIANFANTYEANVVIAVGSLSTSDLAKVIFPKLMKPNLIRINSGSYKFNEDSHYRLFYFPTIVVPDPRTNSRSSIRNSLLLKNYSFFSDSIFLLNVVENADCVFYFPSMFDELSNEKQLEVCHETFFRLIHNYFSLQVFESNKDHIVRNLKTMEWYLTYLGDGQELSKYDKVLICKIIAGTLDGSSFMPNLNDWTWFKLESSLSELTNCRKYEGLALFLPSYIEVVCKKSKRLKAIALELGKSLYGTYSIDGLVYKLLLHMEKHKLPLKFLDIPTIKKVDYRFLSYLIRRAAPSPFSLSLTKAIIKNLTIW